MKSDRLKEHMLENGAKITSLQSRISETVKLRDKSPEGLREWKDACAEFHRRYSTLAFPGGYDGALERIVAGDEDAMEAAICFLECRPYFFRSGYMFKDILRKTKRAPLSLDQADRLRKVESKLSEWRAHKLATRET